MNNLAKALSLHAISKAIAGCYLFLSILFSVCTSQAYAADVIHYYDALGRLIETVGPDGSSVQYGHDAVGNITSVKRKTAGALSISGFVPNSGDVGTVVTIFGSGFNPVAAGNNIKINSLSAVVSGATATSLSFTVPSSATSGLIQVSNANGTAFSAAPFTVVAGRAPPKIATFDPKIGPPGMPVTITGTNFQGTAINNKVLFGRGVAGVSSSTANTISTAAPSGARSGHVSVTTPYGTAVSTDDFFAIPAEFLTSDVAATARLQLDNPGQPFTLAAGKRSVYIFDATSDKYISAGITGGSGSATLYHPSGIASELETTGAIRAANDTYTVVVSAPSTAISGTLYLSSAIVDSLTAGGAAKVFSTSRNGQQGRYTFFAQKGQSAVISFSSPAFTSGGKAVLFQEGKAFQMETNLSSTSFLRIPIVPEDAAYTVQVIPYLAGTGSVNVTLQPRDEAALALDGAALPVTLNSSKLAGTYTFDASAGNTIGLGISDVSNSANSVVEYYVLAPDGTPIFSTTSSGAISTLLPLPSTGKYSVRIIPRSATTLSLKLIASNEIVTPITVDGGAISASSTRAGQSLRFTFDGTPGQRLTIATAAGVTSPYGAILTYTVVNPDGSVLYTTDDTYGFRSELPVLPQSGKYSLRIVPRNAAIGSGAKFWITTRQTGAITLDGNFIPTTLAPGQGGTFTANVSSAPKWVNVGFDFMAGSGSFYKDTRGYFAYYSGSNAIYEVRVAGAVDLLINAFTTNPSALGLRVWLSSTVIGTITPDAAPLTFTTGRPGQGARYSFPGTAGQKLTLSISGNTFNSGKISVVKSNTSPVASGTFADTTLSIASLPATETYTVILDPDMFSKGSIQVRLTLN